MAFQTGFFEDWLDVFAEINVLREGGRKFGKVQVGCQGACLDK
jgi:hypothetical protein